VKALVVACNTATTYAIDDLIAVGKQRGIPVIGVIEPGVEAALRVTKGHVGVIGTDGTIRGGAYTALLQARAPELTISTTACPLFVALAEEGWTDGDIARAVAVRYLNNLTNGPDTLILGCTHYPLLTDAIASALPGVTLVDSATSTAQAVSKALAAQNLAKASGLGTTHFLVTDNERRFVEAGERFFGVAPSPTELIDLDEADQAAWSAEVSA